MLIFINCTGKLSARMLLPGNTWLEVWSSARGIPARKQKRLFDETTEGEKALHFIESQDPAGAAKLVGLIFTSVDSLLFIHGLE